ncbi:hypothetical protein LCGC14_0461670 [marine sediment metagenome]|uniref:SF4 helicase domain-containing protein n=1 Tax=marine sediment metagenome TaxID=412755 RepID=A0A0F9SK28_9ZZZZ
MAFNELFERDFLRMILRREYLVEFAGVIEPELFSFPVYAKLWLIIQKFYFEHKEPPSEATLFELLENAVDDKLFREDEVDILEEYIPPVVNIGTDEVVNFEFVRERVSRWAQERRLRARVSEVVQRVQEGSADVDEAVLLIRGAALLKPTPLDEEDFIITMERRVQGLVDRREGLFIPTGIEPLDRALGGGLMRGSTGYIMGPPHGGKSTFCSHFAGTATMIHLNVVYCYNDESSELLSARLVGHYGGVSRKDFLAGGERALDKTRAACAKLAEVRVGKLILKHLPNYAKPSDVFRTVERAVAGGMAVDVIVVDHIGKMQPEAGMSRDSYHLDVKNVFGELSDLAGEYNCVVLCVMHTNRKGRGKARLDDGMMGLTYEPAKDADFGLGAFRLTEDIAPPGAVGAKNFGRLQIIKARDTGAAGMLFRAEVDFEKCRYLRTEFLGTQEGVANATQPGAGRSFASPNGAAA